MDGIGGGFFERMKKYYLDKAKKELDEKFDDEFEKEFTDKLTLNLRKNSKKSSIPNFSPNSMNSLKVCSNSSLMQTLGAQFDIQFGAQVKQTLFAQGLDESSADATLAGAIAQAKQNGTYQSAYDTAYKEAYQSAYDTAKKRKLPEVLMIPHYKGGIPVGT